MRVDIKNHAFCQVVLTRALHFDLALKVTRPFACSSVLVVEKGLG